MIYVIDLFCGAGGTTSGAHLAGAEVLVCVNHDQKAIESHKANHPKALHFTEDVRDKRVIEKIGKIVAQRRKEEPNSIFVLWASLECTNFSNAKGGLPRDADSRSLANCMPKYIEAIDPDMFLAENVREFMAWGPLDKNGKPVSRAAGRDFISWYNKIKQFGYDAEHKILNSADYGAYQARKRLFIQFSKIGIYWPRQTHSKSTEGLFGSGLKKWKPVRDVLDLNDRGTSIFHRKKPLVEATLRRIYAGLEKFATEKAFLVKNFSGSPRDKVGSLHQPSGTITCNDNKSICFLHAYYRNDLVFSLDSPSPTITTKDRLSCVFIDQQFGNGTPRSIDLPSSSLTTNPKLNTVQAEFLVNPQYTSIGSSLEKPSPTLIARMDKAPLSIATAESGKCPRIAENDSPMTVKIKRFMHEHGICDIKMRMLKVVELKKIQGFSEDYVLIGNQADKKKFIGNAVEVTQAKALFGAIFSGLNNMKMNELTMQAELRCG